MAYKSISKDEFFEINAKDRSREAFAEKVYITIHTLYLDLDFGESMKPVLGKIWKREFDGLYMGNETFEYMKNNDPALIYDPIREGIRNGMRIRSDGFLNKAIVSLEFDLWAVENHRAKRQLQYDRFEGYMRKKYGRSLNSELREFKEHNLCYIHDFKVIAEAIDAYYDRAMEFFELVSKNRDNRMRIYIDNLEVERVEEDVETSFRIETEVKSEELAERQQGVEQTAEQEVKEEKPSVIQKEQEQHEREVKSKEQTLNNHNFDFEYEILVKDMQERIDKLERDIKEFKRQRDDAREYSVNQYDKGIKDLFSQMNDLRYGKVIDYFYSLLKADDTDENLASYLDNFFMILEDMEIEPIAGDEDVVVTESNLTKEYNLDFDKKEYVEGGTEIKYVGWKYKDIPMERPTLKLKER